MQAEMETIQNLFRKDNGPSSSHTIGPERAAHEFALRNPEAVSFAVTLYGSLSLTGKGHLTDRAITEALKPREVEVRWSPESLPRHPNGWTSRPFPQGARSFPRGGCTRSEGEP
jgi:L-serine dehydratase